MISAAEIQNLIQSGENETLEFKSSFNNELIETLVAFANTYGGRVITGVGPRDEITGVSLNTESVQNWLNEIKSKTSPPLIPDVDMVEVGNKTIVVFSIQEYPIKPVASRGKYFKRVANSNHLLSISEVVNLHLQSFNTSWDFHVNNQFKINDISIEKVQIAIDQMNISGFRINDDPLTFLIKNDLIRDGQITNAAYLLFTERDSVLTTIELGKFQTDTLIKDSSRTKSDILTQINEVIDFVKKHINKEIIITGEPRNTEKWQYPLGAIREIVINMIVHRDYRSTSDSLVKIFDDRIEFYNPGKLPESITVEDLLANQYKSTPRNKLIADFCKSLGLIEKYGSGIRRIIEYFDGADLPMPDFRNISDGFMVTVYAAQKAARVPDRVPDKVPDRVPDNLTENQQKILNLLKQNKTVSMAEMAKSIGISKRKVLDNINKLKKLGLVRRIGPAKGGHWEVIK